MDQISTFLMRLPQKELDDIDRVRGAMSRVQWVREICRCMVVARDAFGGPCAVRMRAVPPEEAPDAFAGAAWGQEEDHEA